MSTVEENFSVVQVLLAVLRTVNLLVNLSVQLGPTSVWSELMKSDSLAAMCLMDLGFSPSPV